jgi:7-cyano-7-deazaguanine synthase in queuosine biosynthesis
MITLPNKPKTIGVFVSGGLDSAILYHMVLKANVGQQHTVVPLTLIKNSTSLQFAQTVLNYIHSSFGLPLATPVILDGTQVKPAIDQAYNLGYDRVYVGLIKEMPEFLIGWESSAHPENEFFKTPLKDLTKDNIVRLIKEQQQDTLFYITHSCAVQEVGRCETCNRCRERKWAFNTLASIDPGVL